MIEDGVRFGQFVALAFPGDDMKELRPLQPAQILQSRNQCVQVMAIDGADVVEAQFLEQGARRNHALDMLFDTIGKLQNIRHRGQHLFAGATRGVEGASRQQTCEILVERAHRRRDRHVVVVEDDKQVGVDHPRIVEGLEGLARRHRTVADDGGDAPLLAPVAGGDGHAQRRGDRGG